MIPTQGVNHIALSVADMKRTAAERATMTR